MPAWRTVCKPFAASGSGPFRHGSAHLSSRFLSDAYFVALSLSDGPDHADPCNKRCGTSDIGSKEPESECEESGCGRTIASSALKLLPYPLSNVVFFGVVPERTVAHLEQFRRARPHAFTGIECR